MQQHEQQRWTGSDEAEGSINIIVTTTKQGRSLDIYPSCRLCPSIRPPMRQNAFHGRRLGFDERDFEI